MKKIIIIAISLITYSASSQNSFGEHSYFQSADSYLSSGIPASTTPYPGFIMAGYDPACTSFNFTINRTDKHGGFNSNWWEIQMEYIINADISGSCNGTFSQISSGYGVSIIETSVASNANIAYAVTGVFDEGCFLSFINDTGVPTSIDFFFPFPTTSVAGTITKPCIVQGVGLYLGTWEHYWISGSYNGIIYLLDMAVNGTLITSKAYNLSATASDLTLTGVGDPIIVGTTVISSADTDGFLLKVNRNTFAVSAYYTYDVSSTLQQFSAIKRMVNGDFLIGGYCNDGTSNGYAWFLQIDNSFFSVINDQVVEPTTDPAAGNVVGVEQRYSSFFGNAYQYYGVLSCSSGILVLKLNASLTPFISGTSPNEFLFNSPGTQVTATDISFHNISSGGPDEGLHIYGTDPGSTPRSNFLVQSYFNGLSGCNNTTQINSSYNAFPNATPTATSATTVLGLCTQINLTYNQNGSHSACGPYSSVTGGSNLKGSPTDLQEFDSDIFEIFPNPTSESLTISGNGKQITSVTLFGTTGQLIKTFTSKENGFSEGYTINLKDLALPPGVYLISIKSVGTITNRKISLN